MQVIRSIDIPASAKAVHAGPVAGGTFWSLASVAAVPDSQRQANADAAYLLRHGKLWMQDCAKPGTWAEVASVAELKGFSIGDGTAADGGFCARPYLPELYFVPRTWRGRRAIARAHRRATTRAIQF